MKTIACLLSLALWITPASASEEGEALPIPAHFDGAWLDIKTVGDFEIARFAGKVVVVEDLNGNGKRFASLEELVRQVTAGEKNGLSVVGIDSRDVSLDDLVKVMVTTQLDQGFIRLCGNGITGYTVFDVTGKLVFHGFRRDSNFTGSVRSALSGLREPG